MKLESELRDAFMAEAAASDRPASQIVREMMREFVKRQQEERAYVGFLQRKVDIARRSMAAGRGRSNEEVSADFTRRFGTRSSEIDETDL